MPLPRPPLALAGLAMALAACGQPDTKTYSVKDPATGETAKISVSEKGGEKTVTVNGIDGSGTISVGEGSAPTNLPPYVPAYPGARWQASMTGAAPAAGGAAATAGGMVSFSTPDAPEKVLGFYRDAFAKAGLKETASGSFGQMQMLSASVDGAEGAAGNGAQVMVNREPDGQTQVQIVFSDAR